MSTDPDIQAAWDDAQDRIATRLQPWVTVHKVKELAKEIIDELERLGWRPPLGKVHPVIADARAARQAARAQEET